MPIYGISEPSGIYSIEVEGYKSLSASSEIAVAPLTVLAGANSSGKSSIMQPLLLLKQTLEGVRAKLVSETVDKCAIGRIGPEPHPPAPSPNRDKASDLERGSQTCACCQSALPLSIAASRDGEGVGG